MGIIKRHHRTRVERGFLNALSGMGCERGVGDLFFVHRNATHTLAVRECSKCKWRIFGCFNFCGVAFHSSEYYGIMKIFLTFGVAKLDLSKALFEDSASADL